jgi:threonine dehydrogenase-like Zn-dependent dehydrogenase
VNLLPLPDDVSDRKAILLTDVLVTAYWATECADVREGDTVAIWGAGPIGAMAAMWAKHRKAKCVIVIDAIPDRLVMVKEKLHCMTINYHDEKPTETLASLVPGGVDCVIDAVGFRYAKSWTHAIEKTLMLETDSLDVISEMFTVVRKYGRVGIVGDYVGYANHFPIGQMMEKALTIRGGQLNQHHYWKMLLETIRTDPNLDPEFVITHTFDSIEDVPKAYALFDAKEQGCNKVFVRV